MVNHKRVRRSHEGIGNSIGDSQKTSFLWPKIVVFPDVLNREFCADHPFQKLVTDITYMRVGDTFAYLSAVLDLYNNEIVVWV
jgi:putative transposase